MTSILLMFPFIDKELYQVDLVFTDSQVCTHSYDTSSVTACQQQNCNVKNIRIGLLAIAVRRIASGHSPVRVTGKVHSTSSPVLRRHYYIQSLCWLWLTQNWINCILQQLQQWFHSSLLQGSSAFVKANGKGQQIIWDNNLQLQFVVIPGEAQILPFLKIFHSVSAVTDAVGQTAFGKSC